MTMKTCRQVERYRFHSTDTTTQRIPAPTQWAAVSCTIMKWKCKSSRTKKRRCACMTDSFTTLRKQTQAMWRKTRRWGFWKGRKTAISLHAIRAWMPCTLIKTERRQNTNKRGITFIRDERGRLEKAETDTGSFLEYA